MIWCDSGVGAERCGACPQLRVSVRKMVVFIAKLMDFTLKMMDLGTPDRVGWMSPSRTSRTSPTFTTRSVLYRNEDSDDIENDDSDIENDDSSIEKCFFVCDSGRSSLSA